MFPMLILSQVNFIEINYIQIGEIQGFSGIKNVRF